MRSVDILEAALQFLSSQDAVQESLTRCADEGCQKFRKKKTLMKYRRYKTEEAMHYYRNLMSKNNPQLHQPDDEVNQIHQSRPRAHSVQPGQGRWKREICACCQEGCGTVCYAVCCPCTCIN